MLMATQGPSPDGEGPSPVRYAEQLRKAFRQLNRFMVPMWRLGMGGLLNSWPSVGGQMLVLIHRGRRSGREYRTPLNFALVDGQVYCLAGFGGRTDWYRNALAAPEIQVWLPNTWSDAQVVDVSNDPRRLDLLRAVLIGSGFAAYVAGLNPRRLSDAQLHEKTSDYRLLQLELTTPRTGAGGPGDLTWIWSWVTLLLVLMWGLGRRRRS